MPKRQRPPRTTETTKLRELEVLFEQHRRVCPREAYPERLRAQVLAALYAGAATGAVAQACGVSGTLVRRWRARQTVPTAAAQQPVEPKPRVLAVVDERSASGSGGDDELELRVGNWHVSVRRTVV